MREELNTNTQGTNSIEHSKHSRHLAKGISPIMVCLNETDSKRNPKLDRFRKPTLANFKSKLGLVHNVDYSASPDYLSRRKFLNAGEESYVFSPVDSLDKFSEDFFDCTGLVVTGIDKKTGKKISFLSHQDPKHFLFDKEKKFVQHLAERLSEIKDRSVPGSIDAVVVGGNYFSSVNKKSLTYEKAYLNSIKLISAEVQQVLGFEPIVINGPKIVHLSSDDIYFDNDNRRLYFSRPAINYSSGSFVQSDAKKEKKKWRGIY